MSDLHPWDQHDLTIDVDDIAHPGLDLGAELGYPPEHGMGVDMEMGMGMPLSLDSMGPMAGLGDSLGAELGGDSLQDQLHGDSLGAELGGDLGGPLGGDLNPTTGLLPPEGTADAHPMRSHGSLSAELDTDPAKADMRPSSSPQQPSSSDPPQLADAQARFEERLQATHAQTLAQLNDTIQHTDSFLAKLRPPAGQARVEEDIQKLEATAATVVRQLQETAIQREAQVRELKEAQLVLDVFEPPTHKQAIQPGTSTDASMDAPPTPPPVPAVPASGPHWVSRKAVDADLDDDDQLIESSLLGPPGGDGEDLLGLQLSPPDEQALSVAPATKRAVLRNEEQEGDGVLRRGQVGAGMVAVRDTTSDLLAGLSAMNEHTQVYRAAVNDLSRKFRGLRGALTQIVAETNSTQQSIEWLTRWHERQAADFSARTEPEAGDQHAGLRAWIETVRAGMEQALAEAEGKAHAMLQPPPPPASIAEVDLGNVSLPHAASMPASVAGQA